MSFLAPDPASSRDGLETDVRHQTLDRGSGDNRGRTGEMNGREVRRLTSYVERDTHDGIQPKRFFADDRILALRTCQPPARQLAGAAGRDRASHEQGTLR